MIDNYDSFTYNLVQYLGQCRADVVVMRNDQIGADEVVDLNPDGIMLSPGPCTPKESGVCQDLVGLALRRGGPFESVPMFGVCLGMESMGDVSGGTIRTARSIMHGKSSLCDHDGLGLFEGVANPCKVIRYHSLVIEESSLHPDFVVTARSMDDGEVMGIRHKGLLIEGMQFHPESIDTQDGFRMVENFVAQVTKAKSGRSVVI